MGLYHPCSSGDSFPTSTLSPVWHVLTELHSVSSQAYSNYLIIYRGSKNSYGSWGNNVTTVHPSTAVFATTSQLIPGDDEDAIRIIEMETTSDSGGVATV